jgi:hypothetical protein
MALPSQGSRNDLICAGVVEQQQIECLNELRRRLLTCFGLKDGFAKSFAQLSKSAHRGCEPRSGPLTPKARRLCFGDEICRSKPSSQSLSVVEQFLRRLFSSGEAGVQKIQAKLVAHEQKSISPVDRHVFWDSASFKNSS